MAKRIKIKKVPATTNNITKAIVNFLISEGHSASRVNVQGQYDSSILGWRPSGSRKGFFDIACCVKDSNGIGRFVAIDIKKGNDKLSKAQKVFIQEVENAGGVAIEIGTYDEFLRWYSNYMDVCIHCELKRTKSGHDGCIGTLDNVNNACCGHGNNNEAYVQFDHDDYENDPNKLRISGREALDYIDKHKKILNENT